MAKMIGKNLKILQCPYGCCGDTVPKHTAKVREEAEAFRFEAYANFDIHDHSHGICSDRVTGMSGCAYCYGEDLDDAYDNSDLDEIEGVWCNVDWRRDMKEYWAE